MIDDVGTEHRWWREHFSTRAARMAADRAFDELPLSAPMSRCIDVWVVAYYAAGGKPGEQRYD